LGKALALRILKKGAHLALIARDEKKLVSVKAELQKSASLEQKIEIFPCNVSDFQAVERTFQAIVTKMGIPYMLINSAGIITESRFEEQSLDKFHEIMDTNFFGTLHCIKAVLPYFKQKGKGRVVNICSMAGLMGVYGYSAYCSSKHAVAGLTHTLRCELRPHKIRFHLVCPPEFDSPMVDALNKCRSHENRLLAQTIPVLSAEQVAEETLLGIEKGRYEIIPGKATRIVRILDRLVPRLSRSVVDIRVKKAYQGSKNKK